MLSLVFWEPSSVGGSIIAWWTNSPASHVGIRVGSRYWEALPGKLLESRPWKDVTGYFAEVPVSLCPRDQDKARRILGEKKGDFYDYIGVASFLFPTAYHSLKAQYCSEIAYAATHWLLHPMMDRKLSPGDLYLLASQRYHDKIRQDAV